MDSNDFLYLSARFICGTNDIELTMETYICLFVYIYCELKLNIYLVEDFDDFKIKVSSKILSSIKYTILKKNETEINKLIVLPAIEENSGTFFISGLCSVLRWAIKDQLMKFPGHFSASLLGFRGGCLVACTENSVWTKFCELQLPSSVCEFLSLRGKGTNLLQIPESLLLLEAHLKRPVRTHNILKRKLDVANEAKKEDIKDSQALHRKDSSVKKERNFTLLNGDNHSLHSDNMVESLKNLVITEKTKEFYLKHMYLEGIDLTLADMIAFPCVAQLLQNIPCTIPDLNNVLEWYERMISNDQIKNAAKHCQLLQISILKSLEDFSGYDIVIPEINQDSLYKRDPSHTKMRIKHQNPEKILLLLKDFSIHPLYSKNYCTKLNWNELPPELHPTTGDLPAKRAERKCQQIESIVTATLKIAVKDQTIVEFCAGGGHVGLLLAYYLPECKIILIENKEYSLQRAISRAKALHLKNISFYQCNMDYFKKSFDVGISLHACGVATDLVIQQCIKQQASFVCCPCCYGGIQNTHLLNYPLSKIYRNTGLSYKNYTLLAHCADRTEVDTPTATQGELCMGLIDTDRAYFAKEYNYKVVLTTLEPLSCTPKHNLLIGVSPKWNKVHC